MKQERDDGWAEGQRPRESGLKSALLFIEADDGNAQKRGEGEKEEKPEPHAAEHPEVGETGHVHE